jgi:protein-disulfide isomerase-like protein with CxxC motif
MEMVRKIRDAQYAETKSMSKSEYLRYIKENGGKALEQLKRLAEKTRAAV